MLHQLEIEAAQRASSRIPERSCPRHQSVAMQHLLRSAAALAQNLTLRVRSIGPRHRGHKGGALDMMSFAHDSQAHCMRHQRSAWVGVQHSICQVRTTMQAKRCICCSQSPAYDRQGTDNASGSAAAGTIIPSLSDAASALMAAWAHQVTAVEEHDDSIIVNADRAKVLILFLTATLRRADLCAGYNLHQHAVSYLHDLVSDLRMCTRTHVRPSSRQSAARSISERTIIHTALCKDVLAG